MSTLNGSERPSVGGDVQSPEHAAAIEVALRLASRAQMLGSLHRMAAHDFRDSLNSMSIHIDLLSRTLDAAPASENAAAIPERCITVLRKELKRLAEFTATLEDSRADDGKRQRVRLATVIESLMSAMHRSAQRQLVSMNFVSPPRDVEVMGQPDELRLAMFNMASNAIDAMPEGGTLTFGLATEGPMAVLSVSDTGGGIPAHLQPRVWDLLFSTKLERLGLGLHVVKGIARSHGGAVSLDRHESGSTFTMRLPLERHETHAAHVHR